MQPETHFQAAHSTEFPMINVNKVWFYSAAMAVVIAGVYFNLPDAEQQAKMQAAAAKKKAERAAKRQQSAAQPPTASAPAGAARSQ